MFNKDYIKHLEAEILYLRSQVDSYKEMVIALSDKSREYNSIQYTKEIINPVDDLKKKIEAEPALTELEKKQKEEALNEMKELGII